MTMREILHWNRPLNMPIQHRGSRGITLFSLPDEMNNFLYNFFGDIDYSSWQDDLSTALPAIDIIDNEKDFRVKAEIAGYNPDDIEISVTDGSLTLSGKREEEEEEKGKNYLRREISSGSFQRTIALPETANCDKAEASFKNGVLNIEIPKKAGAVHKPKKLVIKKAP